MLKLDGKTLQYDRAFTHEGISYPANWLRLTTLEEKKAIGITEEVDTTQNYDQRFYWGPKNPKQLDDKTEKVDGVDVTTTGLKTLWKVQQNEIAASLLAPSDWRVIKARETGGQVAIDWFNYRKAVRAACNTRQGEIDKAADVEALKELLFGSPTIQQQKTDSDGKVITETVTYKDQKKDEDGKGVVDSDGKAVMVDVTEERPVFETVANPKLATSWPTEP